MQVSQNLATIRDPAVTDPQQSELAVECGDEIDEEF